MIVVTMADPFPGKRFELRAQEKNGQLAWACGPIDPEKKYFPASCRD